MLLFCILVFLTVSVGLLVGRAKIFDYIKEECQNDGSKVKNIDNLYTTANAILCSA
jgi:hypothetical protein